MNALLNDTTPVMDVAIWVYIAVLLAGVLPLFIFGLIFRLSAKRATPSGVRSRKGEDDKSIAAQTTINTHFRANESRRDVIELDEVGESTTTPEADPEDEPLESKGLNYQSTLRRNNDSEEEDNQTVAETEFGEEGRNGSDDDDTPSTLRRAESDDSMGWSSDEEDRARKEKFSKIKIKDKAEVEDESTAEDLKLGLMSLSLGADAIAGRGLRSRSATAADVGTTVDNFDDVRGRTISAPAVPLGSVCVELPPPIPEPESPPIEVVLTALKAELRSKEIKLWLPTYTNPQSGDVVNEDGSWDKLLAESCESTGISEDVCSQGLEWLRIRTFNRRIAELKLRRQPIMADPFVGGGVAASSSDPFSTIAEDRPTSTTFDPFTGSGSTAADTFSGAAPPPDPFASAPITSADGNIDPFGSAPVDGSVSKSDPFGSPTAPVSSSGSDDPFGSAPEANKSDTISADPFSTSQVSSADPFGASMPPDVNNTDNSPTENDPFLTFASAVADPEGEMEEPDPVSDSEQERINNIEETGIAEVRTVSNISEISPDPFATAPVVFPTAKEGKEPAVFDPFGHNSNSDTGVADPFGAPVESNLSQNSVDPFG